MRYPLSAVIGGLAVLGPPTLLAQEPNVVGVWDIVELVNWSADGERSEPFGQDPNGYFVYTPEGHLILQILPEPLPSRQPSPPGIEDLAARARSSIAYFGTYGVDYDRGILVHEIVGALSPNRSGGDFERTFRFEGQDLVLDFANAATGRRFLRRLRRVEAFDP
ncbi:MAG: lipocalin-like domain-containing protein [marine benthic group bacterium]|nr:lipocalin-like domain-containing protein [Candidatus Carthagonibacter metallireducens]MCL7966209.1 lipocalin-like domain-containing protein [Gemmatimonadota bacterium]MCL7985747.1 lipocalin-like domain-containing protein [Gemmatimonadota bacterium]